MQHNIVQSSYNSKTGSDCQEMPLVCYVLLTLHVWLLSHYKVITRLIESLILDVSFVLLSLLFSSSVMPRMPSETQP